MYRKNRLKLIECNIDDMNPEFYPPVISKLLSSGARDAWISPLVMKHGRPAAMLSVLCEEAQCDALCESVFRETTTIGLRVSEVERYELERREVMVETEFGPITVKEGLTDGGEVVNAAPEFASCQAAAARSGCSVKAAYQAATAAWHQDKRPPTQKP